MEQNGMELEVIIIESCVHTFLSLALHWFVNLGLINVLYLLGHLSLV